MRGPGHRVVWEHLLEDGPGVSEDGEDEGGGEDKVKPGRDEKRASELTLV